MSDTTLLTNSIIYSPLSSIRDTGSFGYEKTTVRTSGSLRVIEDSMRLRNIAVGSISGQGCQNNSAMKQLSKLKEKTHGE
jgi:allophanate hydrolase subunit 2